MNNGFEKLKKLQDIINKVSGMKELCNKYIYININ